MMRRRASYTLLIMMAACSATAVGIKKPPECDSMMTIGVKKLLECSPVPVGGGGTDFTDDANCIGSWLLFSDGTETGAEADRCAAGGTDNMTWTGGVFALGADVPAGTPAGQDSARLERSTNDHLTLAAQVEFGASKFTVLTWMLVRANISGVFGSKNELIWEMRRNAASQFQRHEVAGVIEIGASLYALNQWRFVGMRYDGGGTDEIEVLFGGKPDCSGACSTVAAPGPGTDPLTIGANFSGGETMGARMMEFTYFDRLLTDTELCEVMLCGLDGLASGVVRDIAFGSLGCHCSDISTCC